MTTKRDVNNPWNNKPSSGNPANAKSNKGSANTKPKNKQADQKFKEAREKHEEYAKKHNILDYDSSSDEDLETGSMLESVFKNYAGDNAELQRTQDFLENVFQSGSATCLICIATVKRTEAIWSCEHCFCFFHLACIQRWANDSTSLKKLQYESEVDYYNNRGELIVRQKKVVKWDCPKCRKDYNFSEIPKHYTCFCEKELNPQNHPWLIPHSCGDSCGKALKPDCGHKCVLLCHPGPCPPCPQVVMTSCLCGTSNPKSMRCAQKSWKCVAKCKLKLKCGIHVCGVICHDRSKCPPCSKKSKQSCLCGNSTQERNCDDLVWQCDKKCNKLYQCGIHSCQQKCHIGDCGDCPLGRPRECPCGKQKTKAPCSEEIGPCGDTCQKMLECEQHICVERCHKGNCSPCIEIIRKQCRCGQHSKELPCSKSFLCDTKCKQMRDCNKHACSRKCCDNQCPPCDKVCGKTLSCGKHKCTSLCHHGPCYPCTAKAPVKCRCGKTVINVACGREKKTKPPKCLQPCRIPSKCHHDNPHNCHQYECPPCTQLCLLANDTTNCDHLCQVKCHDSVKVSFIDKNFKPAGPWEKQVERIEIQKLPHPPCNVEVPVVCIGGHEKVLWPCWNSQPSSCGRKCGRQLFCGNHFCQNQCHSVTDMNSKKQDDLCGPCQEDCIFERSNGCIHPCEKPCHTGECDLCVANIKTVCHCGLTQVYYKCGDYFRHESDESALAADREKMKSCGNRCIKNYNCGHRCIDVCHSGKCLNSEACKKKSKVYCECKTRKVDATCDKIRAGFQLTCDDTCKVRREEMRLAAEEQDRKQKEIEDEKNRLEMLDFEKKFGKKKFKERKRSVVEETESKVWMIWIGIPVVLAVVSVIVYFVFA
ncbi:NF-X1-type zinc finger protein NFXL1 [Bradysia coprophila]|uniref:NF-X1-type zinc finger protein NFXL1 n=1 Tax=Bradysia coprophila TaxID=38358 RepID=UPI00187D8EAB|nr:NF-X1-type zinc finger protein NFXL1 [Bradysia coprophila]